MCLTPLHIYSNWQWEPVWERSFTIEMISIFPLWIFHLHVTTFQQHLYLEYISLFIRYSRGLLLTRKLLDQRFLVAKLKSSLRRLYGRHHDLVNCYGIYVSQMSEEFLIDVRLVFTHICFVGGSCFIYRYVICFYLCILMYNTVSISQR